MKCISVIQPWATLIILGAKNYETRGWASRYRGPLAIHASTRFPPRARQLCSEEPFRAVLGRAGVRTAVDLSRGLILGTVRFAACTPLAKIDLRQLPGYEFGDYMSGRWVWLFGDPRPLIKPFAVRGVRGIFEIPTNELDSAQRDLSSMAP
jgi:hypothetical protein